MSLAPLLAHSLLGMSPVHTVIAVGEGDLEPLQAAGKTLVPCENLSRSAGPSSPKCREPASVNTARKCFGHATPPVTTTSWNSSSDRGLLALGSWVSNPNRRVQQVKLQNPRWLDLMGPPVFVRQIGRASCRETV